MRRMFFLIALGATLMAPSTSKGQPFAFDLVQHGLDGSVFGSVVWTDANEDGLLDVFLAGNLNIALQEQYATRLSLNAGNGSSVDTSGRVFPVTSYSPGDLGSTPVLWQTATVAGDFDNDGDVDIVLSGTGSAEAPFIPNLLLLENEDGSFADRILGVEGVVGGDLEAADYDGDGDLDLVITGTSVESEPVTTLAENIGGDFQSDSDATLAQLDLSDAAFADYDLDGDPDLAICGRSEAGSFQTILYRNEAGVLVDSGTSLYGLAFCTVSWGDLDSDGDPDLAISGMTPGFPFLETVRFRYRNDSGRLTETEAIFPAVSLGSLTWPDLDNDGDLDLLQSGILDLIDQDVGTWIYRNDGNRLVPGTRLGGLGPSEAVAGDYDGDGDLDVLANGATAGINGTLNQYRNGTVVINNPPEPPDELSANVTEGGVELTWTAGSDDLTPAPVLSYDVRVGTSPLGVDIVTTTSTQEGRRLVPGPGNAGQSRRLVLRNLEPGTYYWSVRTVDGGYRSSAEAPEQSFDIALKTDVSEDAGPPRTPGIAAFPRPFSDRATLVYHVPTSGETRLEIFDLNGRRIRLLDHGDAAPGRHEVDWDATTASGSPAPAGVYFCRLTTPAGSAVTTLFLVR